MKIARFFAVIFAVLGTVLMLGTAVVCFASTDASVKVKEAPKGAVECVQQLMQALDSGDLAAAGTLFYGQPDLGGDAIPEDSMTALLWQAYLDGFSCEGSGKMYLEGEAFAQDLTVTTLDVAALTAGIQLRAKNLLEQRVQTAQDMKELYDEENNFHQDLIEQVLQQAVAEAIAQDARYVTIQGTVKLICREGRWWAVPDQALQQALKGPMA